MVEDLAVEQSKAFEKLTANLELTAFNSKGNAGAFPRSTSLLVPANPAYTSLLAISARDSSFMEKKDRCNKPRDKGREVEHQLLDKMPKWQNFYFKKLVGLTFKKVQNIVKSWDKEVIGFKGGTFGCYHICKRGNGLRHFQSKRGKDIFPVWSIKMAMATALVFTEEEIVIDPVPGYPTAFAKLCRDKSFSRP